MRTNQCSDTKDEIRDDAYTIISGPLALLFLVVWLLCMVVPDV